MSFFNKKANYQSCRWKERHLLHPSFTVWACLLLSGHSHGVVNPFPGFLWIKYTKWPPYWKMGNLVCKFTVYQQQCRTEVWSKGKEVGAKFWCHWKVLHHHPSLILLCWEREKCFCPPWEVLHSPEMEVCLSRDERQPLETWKKKQLSAARSNIFSNNHFLLLEAARVDSQPDLAASQQCLYMHKAKCEYGIIDFFRKFFLKKKKEKKSWFTFA